MLKFASSHDTLVNIMFLLMLAFELRRIIYCGVSAVSSIFFVVGEEFFPAAHVCFRFIGRSSLVFSMVVGGCGRQGQRLALNMSPSRSRLLIYFQTRNSYFI